MMFSFVSRNSREETRPSKLRWRMPHGVCLSDVEGYYVDGSEEAKAG